MIAMEVVGWVLFGLFILWEWRGSMHPLCPRRVFNRTFNCCLVIDVTYMIGGMMALTICKLELNRPRLLHPGSSANAASPLRVILALRSQGLQHFRVHIHDAHSDHRTLCLWSPCRYRTTRHPQLQISPTVWSRNSRNVSAVFRAEPRTLMALSDVILRSGMGITYWAVGSHASTGALVATQILIGAGGGFSVVGSQVASQASVPHADLSTVVALLPLFSSLGSSAGSAISTSIWNSKLPQSLTRHLVDTGLATAEEVIEIFGSISVARALPEPVLSQARLGKRQRGNFFSRR